MVSSCYVAAPGCWFAIWHTPKMGWVSNCLWQLHGYCTWTRTTEIVGHNPTAFIVKPKAIGTIRGLNYITTEFVNSCLQLFLRDSFASTSNPRTFFLESWLNCVQFHLKAKKKSVRKREWFVKKYSQFSLGKFLCASFFPLLGIQQTRFSSLDELASEIYVKNNT